jgi:hypothetical protein
MTMKENPIICLRRTPGLRSSLLALARNIAELDYVHQPASFLLLKLKLEFLNLSMPGLVLKQDQEKLVAVKART